MAKRKRKKASKENSANYIELIGIVLVLISILGIGRYGLVGKLVSAFSVFLTGVGYNILLVILLILGGYIIIKREHPKYFNKKLIGLYIAAIGVLILCHFKYVTNYNQNASLILSKTMDDLLACFNNIMSSGLVNITGGGLIGCLFAVLFNLLFALQGTKIVSIVFIVLGLCMFTGFSILDIIKNMADKAKNIHLPTRIHDSNEEEGEEEEIEEEEKKEPKTKVIISSAEEVNRVLVDENKKVESNSRDNTVIKNHVYELPPITLLNPPKKKAKGTDSATIEKNIEILEKVLKDFKIIGKVVEVHIGPTVAQYELEIASGTRVNKITSINREIALALAKKDVRIEAPIPGKNTVGIEFANEVATPVSFYEIISSKLMMNQMDKKLMVPLGKSIMGDIGVCEINKMPHMLIAGTTGSGKSVCVNGIICSILMRARPDEVKLVMVDPKVVELSVYNGIPHLLCPVVTDPKKASAALAKMVNEMENRYSTFSETKTKSIETYNAYVEKYNEKHKEDPKKKMPYIVIIIDELSDLMMVAAKEVEDSILRITQKARAAGIHLIVATQRPSTEVITGLIKANIPSRIAFTVGSGIDSRTILDMVGAEKLLGKGDMLYLPIGSNSPIRIQGSFITDEEIGRIIDFTINQQKAQYDESLMNLQPIDTSTSTVGKYDNDDYDDPLYNDIVDFVVEQKKASTSLIQRRFKLGYNRAARIVDLLEERGVIGPQNGSKPREVLLGKGEEEE